MKKMIITIMILASFHALSKEKWFCTDDQAMRSANTLSICGVGTAENEGWARKRSLDNAVNEFQVMCELSSDCKQHKIVVDPKRSTCFKEEGKFTCHRLFIFTIEGAI